MGKTFCKRWCVGLVSLIHESALVQSCGTGGPHRHSKSSYCSKLCISWPYLALSSIQLMPSETSETKNGESAGQSGGARRQAEAQSEMWLVCTPDDHGVWPGSPLQRFLDKLVCQVQLRTHGKHLQSILATVCLWRGCCGGCSCARRHDYATQRNHSLCAFRPSCNACLERSTSVLERAKAKGFVLRRTNAISKAPESGSG
jgi:hypothetical protein